MEYATLGRTGRRVSRLGFGGATAGLRNYLGEFDPERAEDREPVVAAIRRALDLGVTYFDTAAGYGAGASERLFGEGLADADPEAIFLATKAGVCDADGVRRSLEASLRNLRREWIDLLQVHGSAYAPEQCDAILADGGMLAAMERMRDQGLVRWLGFTSEAQNPGLYRLIASGRFDVMQVCYNLIYQHPCDPSRGTGCLYDAEAAGLGIVTMRSATSGIFQKWVQTVNPANAFDYTPALIQFVLSNPLVDVALVGMRAVAEVEANARLADDRDGRIDLDALHQRYV
ncbi:MAG: aldo/keto reductase [Planctomycetota bacterium]